MVRQALEAAGGNRTQAAKALHLSQPAVSMQVKQLEEEVGLPRERVEVLGTLSPHRTVTAFEATPVLALVRGSFVPVPEEGEVAEAFFAPFEHVTDPKRFRIEGRRWRGVRWRRR